MYTKSGDTDKTARLAAFDLSDSIFVCPYPIKRKLDLN